MPSIASALLLLDEKTNGMNTLRRPSRRQVRGDAPA
jgi:hypothetical protein